MGLSHADVMVECKIALKGKPIMTEYGFPPVFRRPSLLMHTRLRKTSGVPMCPTFSGCIWPVHVA